MQKRRIMWALLIMMLGFGLAGTVHTVYAGGNTATLKGRVIQADGTPVVGATIVALAGPTEDTKELARTMTGNDGSWQMDVPAGETVWAHFNTFGPWWGYSYAPPFNLQPSQVVTGVDFVLAPRSVAEVPTPAPTAVPTDTPAPPPTETPVPPPPTETPAPPPPTPVPTPGMPTTGGGTSLADVISLFILALSLVLAGSLLRRQAPARR